MTAEYGSWLSLRFGQPHLRIREGTPEAKLKSLKRRAVFVEGEFLLWVEMGAWKMSEERKRLFHSEQSRGYLHRAARRLDGQKLARVEIKPTPLGTIFTFDHGCKLHVCAAEGASSDEALWHIYGLDKCLSLLADGTLEYGPSKGNKRHRMSVRNVDYAA